jgi:hypothetical protein
MGLNGFQARSEAPNGVTVYAATYANLATPESTKVHVLIQRDHSTKQEPFRRTPAPHHAPLKSVCALVRLVKQVGVFHDFCGLLQDGKGLHDEHGHAEQRRHVHANILLELLGAPRLLALLHAHQANVGP